MSPPEAPRPLNPEPMKTRTASPSSSTKKPAETAVRPVRRFAPEPVETSFRSSKKARPSPVVSTPDAADATNSEKKSKEAAVVQPAKASTECGRDSEQLAKNPATGANKNEASLPPKSPRRRFTPQLIETAKRSRKAGDTTPAVLPSDRTEVTPGDIRNGSKQARRRPLQELHGSSPQGKETAASLPTEEPRTRPSMGRSNSRGTSRKHSFRVPTLECIESSDSDESGPPSLATSLSTTSELSSRCRHGRQPQESVDDRVSTYILQLAARSAEKRLHEQAMAAFPNSDYHEHIDHFVDRESDDDDTVALEQDASGSEVNWELKAMLQHHENLQKERQKGRRSFDLDQISSRSSTDPGPYGDPLAGFFPANESVGASGEAIGGWHKDPCLEKMRLAASPPMLGGDIEFPRCFSPDPAQFEAKKASSADSLPDSSSSAHDDGLWHSDARCERHMSAQSGGSYHGGLWRGLCDGSAQPSVLSQTGLLTPRFPTEECPECVASPSFPFDLPPSPPEAASIDEKLMIEKAVQEEFDDTFITQVYNYLSLGYPALARQFDQELSKISGIPVSELRQDDNLGQTRGYIGLGENGNSSNHETCMRWQALRIYVWEWGRQQPLMSKMYPGGGAVAIRRGSWAI